MLKFVHTLDIESYWEIEKGKEKRQRKRREREKNQSDQELDCYLKILVNSQRFPEKREEYEKEIREREKEREGNKS